MLKVARTGDRKRALGGNRTHGVYIPSYKEGAVATEPPKHKMVEGKIFEIFLSGSKPEVLGHYTNPQLKMAPILGNDPSIHC